MINFVILLAIGLPYLQNGVWCGSHHETTAYVDTLVRVALPDHVQNSSVDPYPMPNFEVRAESGHGITVKGKCSQGRMLGLGRIARIGQCGGPATAPGGNVTFNCTMGINKLNISYTCAMKYGILPSSNSIVVANLTRPFGKMEVTSLPRGGSPALKSFTVATLGQMDTTISGGLYHREYPHIREDFTLRVVDDVQQAFLGSFKTILSQAVSSTPLPSSLLS